MNHAKKLISGLLSVVMLLVMATTAFAVEGETPSNSSESGSASITISNPSSGVTYSVYKLFDATVTGSKGGSIAYTGTIPESLNAYFVKDSNGYISVTDDAYTDKTKTEMSEGLRAALKTWTSSTTASATEKSDGTELTFSNLPYGYYVVTTTQGEQAITVTSTNPTATIVDKNQEPTWGNEDKDGDGGNQGKVIVTEEGNKTVNSANYGDTVNFSVAVNAVSYAKNADGKAKLVTYYHIKDTLGAGFTLDEKSIKVKVGAAELASGAYTFTKTNDGFTVDVPFGEKYGSNAVIEVNYSATVNTSAVIAGTAGNTNTANFTYTTDDNYDPNKPSYDPKDPTKYPKDDKDPSYPDGNEKTTTTYVYAIALQKVNETGKSLAGATFQLPFYVKETATNSNIYNYVSDSESDGSTNTVTTPDTGLIIIKGVEGKEYEIIETQAPDGYNKLTKSVKVTAQKTDKEKTTVKTYLDADGNISATETKTVVTVENDIPATVEVVVNKTGAELPSTGGMGTTLFYALGGVLVTGAAILLVVKKRMERSSQ